MNNGTKRSIEAKILGNKDAVEEDFDRTQVEPHHTHDNNATKVTPVGHGCMKEIPQVGVVGLSSDRTAADVDFKESTEVFDDYVESLSGHESASYG